MMAYRTDSKTFSNLSLRVQDMWPDNCLFHAVHGLDKAQAGIKITGRNINNLRYEDDAAFMAESEEELQSLLMKV